MLHPKPVLQKPLSPIWMYLPHLPVDSSTQNILRSLFKGGLLKGGSGKFYAAAMSYLILALINNLGHHGFFSKIIII